MAPPDISKCVYFLRKTNDFQYVALLARRHDFQKSLYFLRKTIGFWKEEVPVRRPVVPPNCSKSMYFLRKTNDFQDCTLHARRACVSNSYLWEATGGHGTPQEATGGHRRPREATGGHGYILYTFLCQQLTERVCHKLSELHSVAHASFVVCIANFFCGVA